MGNKPRQKATIDYLTKSSKQAVDRIVSQLMGDDNTPGLELAIQMAGTTVYECGYGDITVGEFTVGPPGPTTRFQIDSLTKSLTAFAVLRLAEQGIIDLDKPIGEYLPLPNLYWNAIPVRQYLGMITGIPDESTTDGSYQDLIGSAGFKQTPYGLGIDFEPGSQFEYSNTNYFILGELIGAWSPQKSYMAYTKANVLAPLGMNDTGLLAFGKGTLWATPYEFLNGHFQAQEPRKPIAGFSAGGFVSTMSDLEKFGIGLSKRAVLSSKSYEQMWTRTKLTSGTRKGETINFGLGWDVVALDYYGKVGRVSKNGRGWGWGSQLTYFPQTGHCVILLRNSSGSGNLTQAAIDIYNVAVEQIFLAPAKGP